MKQVLKIFFLAAFTVILLVFTGCGNKNVVIDQNIEVANHNWTYLDKFKYTVKIDNEKTPYNLYMNVRVTADYKYSNLFVLISETGPDKRKVIKRYELKLASKDGEWLGKGTGNLYAYQLPFLTGYKFPVKGIYTIQIEQNMRDNPLHEVSDVGLRVEKAQ